MIELPVLEVPEGYLEEEERCGYRVSRKRKEIWAVELDLYITLERVCKKYGLALYADAGTLLGAVRHNGFIPWDDDMDFVMFRDDYDRLCEIGETEFESPYFMQTDDNCRVYRHGHIQLRNSDTTAIVLSDKEKGFMHNQGIFIDVFPIDGLPEASKRREYWSELIELNEAFKDHQKRGSIEEANKYYELLEKCLKRYPPKTQKKAALLSYELNGKKGNRFVSDYLQSMFVQFEFLEMRIPAGYNNILRTIYGIWKTPMIIESDHKDVIFDVSKSYTEYLK